MPEMRVLVTGAQGASAQALIERLSEERRGKLFLTDLRVDESANCVAADLSISSVAYQLVAEISPHRIYNLAGTFSNNYETDYTANVLLTKNLLDSVLKANLECRILLLGSAAEYGWVSEEDTPIKETLALNPVSVYGLTKVFQTQLMNFYHAFYHMNVVMARSFNLIGSGFSERLFIGSLMAQILKYKNGDVDRIVLGNLEGSRDYISVRDAAKHYDTIMELGDSGGVYNVGSGVPVRMSELLSGILSENGLDMSVVEQISTEQKDKLDVRDSFADISKLKSLYGNEFSV